MEQQSRDEHVIHGVLKLEKKPKKTIRYCLGLKKDIKKDV